MNALTRFVLDHKRFVVGFWLAVTVAAFAAIGPAGSALSQQFSVPGREGFQTNKELAATYGNGSVRFSDQPQRWAAAPALLMGRVPR
jgi:putative drug exporter of the RND superfamily